MSDGSMVRTATLEDAPSLLQTLVRAFDEDPVLRWFLRQDARRREAYELFFRFMLLEQTLPFGEALARDDGQATALWVPPGRWRLSLWRQLRGLPDILRATSWGKLGRGLRGFAQMDAHHPREPHMYLAFLAVAPESRGTGQASRLVRPVLERCDREGLGAYLENTNPRNTALYEHLGFEVTGPIDLGPGAPPYLAMWRGPRR